MKRFGIFLLIVSSIVIVTNTGTALGEHKETQEDMLPQETLNEVEFLPRQGNQTGEPQPINLYLYEGAGGSLKAGYPGGNSSTQVECPASTNARLFGEPVGTWTSSPITSQLTLNAEIFGSIWAKSDQGSNGVHFRIIVMVNGNDIGTWIETDTHDLSTIPTEFTGSDNGGGELQLNIGDTIGVQVVYFAAPMFFIGPNSPSTMLLGSSECDTCITVTTSPMIITVNEPLVGDGFVTFSATFIDAFASSKLNARLTVNGKSDVNTVSAPIFSISNNGSIVSWDWDYRTDKASNGEYTITISLSYSEENEFRTMGTYILKFPEASEDGGVLGGAGWLIPLIIVVVIIAVIVVVVKIVMARRSPKSTA